MFNKNDLTFIRRRMANSDVLARLWRDAPEAVDEQWVNWWAENGWSADITWHAIEGAPDDVGPMHGRERLGRHYGEWLELFEDIRIEASGFVDIGERVIARVHFSARSKSTGMPLAIDYAVDHELNASGRIAAGREYATEAEAIQAAEAADAGHVSATKP